MTPLADQLQKVGLTENQASVYLALTRAGEAKAGELIKKTGMHRNIVYTVLEELAEKKLIAYSHVRGVLLYKALSPARLLLDAQERERTAKNVIEELHALSRKKSDQEIIVYEGIDEFRRHAMRSYSLAKSTDLMRYLGTSPHWHTIIGAPLEEELVEIQKEKKLHMRGIAKNWFPDIKKYLGETKGLTAVRINPLISSDTNNVEILADRICLQSFTPPYFVVEIINSEVAKNYQNYFDFLWTKSKSA